MFSKSAVYVLSYFHNLKNKKEEKKVSLRHDRKVWQSGWLCEPCIEEDLADDWEGSSRVDC